MKPDRQTAMRKLIQEVRIAFPFDLPEAHLCDGVCKGCSQKLLDFIDMELDDWEQRLDNGEIPNFGDINKIARTCTKIHRVLKANGLVNE